MISMLLRMALVGLLIYALLRMAGAVVRTLTGGQRRQADRSRRAERREPPKPGFDFDRGEVLDVPYHEAEGPSDPEEPDSQPARHGHEADGPQEPHDPKGGWDPHGAGGAHEASKPDEACAPRHSEAGSGR